MAKAKTWEQQRAAAIEADLRTEYGRGWDKLADEHRSALVSERVLMLVLGQFGAQFKPAQDMARAVLLETKHHLFKRDPDEAAR